MQPNDYEKIIQCEVMKWYGWGSPIGLTTFFLGIAGAAALLRYVFTGVF